MLIIGQDRIASSNVTCWDYSARTGGGKVTIVIGKETWAGDCYRFVGREVRVEGESCTVVSISNGDR